MLSGIIYMHRISDGRFTGIAGRNFKMFCELCGDEALKNVVIVTNMWSEVSPEVGEAREGELSNVFFKPVLDKSAQMARHQNTVQSAHDVVRKIVTNTPLVLQIQRELLDEHKDIAETAAGKLVNRELNDQIERHRTELDQIQQEMEQAKKEGDEETRRELEEEKVKLQEQMEKIKKDSERMAARYAAEKERIEAKVKELEREANEERERTKAEHRRQLANLNRRPQGVANVSVPDLPRLEKGVKRPQDRSGSSGGDDWIPIPIYK